MVTAAPGYSGLLTNTLQVSTAEGMARSYACVIRTEEPIAGLSAANDSPTALGSPTTLTATVTAGSSITYTWAFGNGSFGTDAIISHAYTATAVYTAAVTASNSVSQLTATTTVIVEEAIAGLMAANDSPTMLGDPTTLSATVTAGSHVTYTWAFGDGTLGGGAMLTHTYPAAGVYTVIVTTSNSVSVLTSTTTVTITATGPTYSIYLPLVVRG